jgi:hypothetical protein
MRRSQTRIDGLVVAGLVVLACSEEAYVPKVVEGRQGQTRAVAKPRTDPTPTARRAEPPAEPPPAPEPVDAPQHGAKGQGIARIQASKLRLSPGELRTLDHAGFVVSANRRFPTFAHGYVDIYVNDLPLFVSADSILDPIHRSYRSILRSVEEQIFVPAVTKLLDDMRAKLAAGAVHELGADTEADLDVYLGVPLRLLTGREVAMVAGGSGGEVQRLARLAIDAGTPSPAALFGELRDIDFSQYKPRGHYAGNPILERYFRAMMWLGREDARLVETDDRGEPVLRKRALDDALAMRALLDSAGIDRWTAIDRALDAFVGKRDSMSFPELGQAMQELGTTDPEAAAKIADGAWLATLVRGNYGRQRIAGSIHGERPDGRPSIQPRSFTPFGQRFVVDSEVFSHLVYDRLPDEGGPPRLLPKPLDVAYAVFDNGRARALLRDDVARFYALGGALEVERAAVNRLEPAFWQDSLYNSWLYALRTLSPGSPHADALPPVARTNAWATRILNTQLASWAELRHDTVLYAKQSYTVSLGCSYPDAYVDPYPEFFAALDDFARRGAAAAGEFAGPGKQIAEYFAHLGKVTAVLGDIAKRELRGEPLTPDDLRFINDAVKIHRTKVDAVCTTEVIENLEGWYARLFFDPSDALDYDPTIVDVHTQPTDEAGNEVGKVLHVGTGKPRLMVVTAETCNGSKTYVGLASSYYEEVTSGFHRLTDQEWKGMVDSRSPPSFLESIQGR